MIEYGIQPENLQQGVQALGLLLFAIFTIKQRDWIKQRDGNVCQACLLGLPHSSECNGHPDIPENQRRLQVHHVIPQRYAKEIGMDNADYAENGITLGASFHQQDIHPDMKEALKRYRAGDKDAFKRVGVNRDAMLSERTIYWNSTHDRVLQTRAIQNTQRFEPDNPFPPK